MKNSLDQFYTNSDAVKLCLENLQLCGIRFENYDNILEPSAGSAKFLELLPSNAIGLDLDPTHPRVEKADFLKWDFDSLRGSTITVGNPPFGKNSSLAVNFFNRSAHFSDVIAFILPRTFKKKSIINRLDSRFHLLHEILLPLDSFHTPDGAPRNVPTCFQIWVKSDISRPALQSESSVSPDWDWVSNIEAATHAIRRVGVFAGKLVPTNSAASASHFFVRSKSDEFEENWNKTWERYWVKESEWNPKWDVAGNPSLTKSEMVSFYNRTKNNV